MTEPLAVIVPTRGRPGNAARLAAAFRDTHALDAVPVFVADAHDPQLPAYRRLLEDRVISRLVVPPASGQPSGPGGMQPPLNYAAMRYASLYEAVGFMGDDHLPRTANWDSRIMEELDSLEPRIVYGNDLFQGAALPTAVFMQSRMVKALGFMAPRVLRHLYIDNFWKELGEQLGALRYLPDVVIEHLHPAAGKAAMDDRYRAVNAPEVDDGDRAAWLEYRDEGGFEYYLKKTRKEYGLDPRPAA